jgi:hypothetical protein
MKDRQKALSFIREGATGSVTFDRTILGTPRDGRFTIVSVRSRDFIIKQDSGHNIYCSMPTRSKETPDGNRQDFILYDDGFTNIFVGRSFRAECRYIFDK